MVGSLVNEARIVLSILSRDTLGSDYATKG